MTCSWTRACALLAALRRRGSVAALALGALVASSCLGPVLPIPPPGVSAFTVEPCVGPACPADGGLLVRVSGTAREGALVVLENLSRTTPAGARYVVSTYARRVEGGSAMPDAGTIPPQGVYDLVLGPLADLPGAPPVLSRSGDRVVVYQFARDEQGALRLSSTSDERVVRGP